MVTKFLKITGLFLLMTTLTGCPGGDDDCFDYGATVRVDNLLKLSPLQATYNQGQIVTFKILIPATNTYFGEELNLFEKTNDYEAFLLTSYSALFTGNELTFIKGSQGSEINWFNVPYNNITNMYEFEVNIKLNRIGSYVLYTNDYLTFQGSTKCNRYRLDTNIEGWNSEGKIEFNVQ
jgi:hypothetical protein